MLITAAFVALAPTALLYGLRNGWYMLHLLLVLAVARWLEQLYSFSAFSRISFVYAIAIHVTVINLITFALYGWDKRAARRGRFRVAERSLHDFALVGGSMGAAIGSRIFRHKTLKGEFKRRFRIIVTIQLAALFVTFYCLIY